MQRYYRYLVLPVTAWLLAFNAMAEESAPATPNLEDYTTCAVYYRMMVGSMSARYGRDLGPLAEIERDKMNTAMDYARAQAGKQYGKDKAEAEFKALWSKKLAEMTDAINRSYDNIGNLKYRYKDGCKKLISGPAPD